MKNTSEISVIFILIVLGINFNIGYSYSSTTNLTETFKFDNLFGAERWIILVIIAVKSVIIWISIYMCLQFRKSLPRPKKKRATVVAKQKSGAEIMLHLGNGEGELAPIRKTSSSAGRQSELGIPVISTTPRRSISFRL